MDTPRRSSSSSSPSSASSSSSRQTPLSTVRRRQHSFGVRDIYRLALLSVLVLLVSLPQPAHGLTFFVGTSNKEGGEATEGGTRSVNVQPGSSYSDSELRQVYAFCKLLPRMRHKVKSPSEASKICADLMVQIRKYFDEESAGRK